MTKRWWVGAALALVVASSACDGCKKDSATQPTSGASGSASGSSSAKAYEPPMVLGMDASGPVIPPPRPPSSIVRPNAVSSDAPGVCKTDAECPTKSSIEQLCCISTTAPGGPGLFCQDKALPCQRACVTDADCRVGKRCDVVKGTASGVMLRGCF
ncbi:MAG: hypothetical protein JWM74_1990 [Myxococcaceae bacterium]|nr:hypothetical protein [Myxococcaceae bacterium]